MKTTTQCTLAEFQKHVLPGLVAKHKTPELIQKAAAIFIDENQVVDADGNAVMADQLNIVTVPAEEPAEEPQDEPAADDTPSAEEVEAIVADQLTKYFEAGNGPRTGNKAMTVHVDAGSDINSVRIPATAKRFGALKAFKGEGAEERAYMFGHWFLADVVGNRPKSLDVCKRYGLRTKDMTEGILGDGGALVPDEFANDLIVLREEYGVFRPNARTEPMSRDTKSVPKLGDEVAATWAGEATALTEGDEATSLVQLTAKKLTRLTQMSNELDEDAAINLGDTLAQEMARAFAKAEDTAGFVGTGVPAHGGIQGVASKIQGLSATRANIACYVVGAGNLFSELTLANFNSCVGLLPEYADNGNTAWYVHKKVWADVMQRLAYAAGGNTTELVAAGIAKSFMGYPVRTTQVMPKADANDQVVALFGDLSQTAILGDRRQITVATSEHVGFTSDLLTIKATSRLDINVHSFGNASGTAASRVVGPIVALASAAS